MDIHAQIPRPLSHLRDHANIEALEKLPGRWFMDNAGVSKVIVNKRFAAFCLALVPLAQVAASIPLGVVLVVA
jgi:hypothetical protein